MRQHDPIWFCNCASDHMIWGNEFVTFEHSLDQIDLFLLNYDHVQCEVLLHLSCDSSEVNTD